MANLFTCKTCKDEGEYFHPCPDCGEVATCFECGSQLGSRSCDCENPETCFKCAGTKLVNWCECWDNNWISLGGMLATDFAAQLTDFAARLHAPAPQKSSWKKLKKSKPKPVRLTIRFDPAAATNYPTHGGAVTERPKSKNDRGTE